MTTGPARPGADRRARLRASGDGLPLAAPDPEALLERGCPISGIGRFDRTLTLTSAILRETSIRTRARGATPLFVIPVHGPNRPLDQHAEAWVVRALFVQHEIPFILVDIPPDQLLNGDFHPGPRGDETIAAAILAALPPR
jgi:hypothetical protein